MKTNKKAYTLIELGISMIVLSIVIGIYINITKATYDKNRFEDTTENLQVIKKSLLAYAATNGKLPQIANGTDGVGDSADTIGYLPYIDLQTNAKDEYGMVYSYDVLTPLTTTTSSDICSTLSTQATATPLPDPQVTDDSGANNYTVAAIIISKGNDKILSGTNVAGDRIYEMKSNLYNDTTNNDLVEEITLLELYGEICSN